MTLGSSVPQHCSLEQVMKQNPWHVCNKLGLRWVFFFNVRSPPWITEAKLSGVVDKDRDGLYSSDSPSET